MKEQGLANRIQEGKMSLKTNFNVEQVCPNAHVAIVTQQGGTYN